MKKVFTLLVGLALTVTLVACGSKSLEGTLVVYSPNSEGIMNAVIPLFEEETGIEVEVISAGTGELVARIQNEQADPYGDVMFGGSYATYLENADLFQDYVSKEDKNVEEGYRNTTGYVTYTVLDGSLLIVNKKLTEGMTIDSYADLLDPALKGKISSADPTSSSSAFAQLTNILLAMSGEEGGEAAYMSDTAWDYVAELLVQLDGKVASGSSAVYKSVVDGEMAVGLSYEDPCATLVKDGATNIELVYPSEGAVYLPAGTGIVKGAKNLDNAKAFVDFLLSEEVQNIFGTTLSNRPVRIGAETGDYMKPFADINVVYEDMEWVSQNKSMILDRYTELVSGE